jgi:hypothetical protein
MVLTCANPDGSGREERFNPGGGTYVPVAALYADTTPIMCPAGKVITELRLMQSNYGQGFETNNRLVPVLTCSFPDGSGVEFRSSMRNNSFAAGLAGMWADTTASQAPPGRQLRAFQLVKAEYWLGFQTNNRVVPAALYGIGP